MIIAVIGGVLAALVLAALTAMVRAAIAFERRRVAVMVARLQAEAQMKRATHETIRQMRDAVLGRTGR